jgi:hypothetical protein
MLASLGPHAKRVFANDEFEVFGMFMQGIPEFAHNGMKTVPHPEEQLLVLVPPENCRAV